MLVLHVFMKHVQLLKQHLRNNRHSPTSSRLTVFQALEKLGPCSVQDLEQYLSLKTHRSSVYRTIQLFEELGIVRRIPIGWKYKLELSDMFSDHHHHAHCNECQKVVKLEENASLEHAIEKLAQDSQFQLTSHSLEMQGVCRVCQTKKDPR